MTKLRTFATLLFLLCGCGAPPAPPVVEARASTSRETPKGCQPLVAEVKLHDGEEPFCLEGSLQSVKVLVTYSTYTTLEVHCGCR